MGILVAFSVNPQTGSSLPLFPDRIGIQKCWFLWREKNRKTRRKTLEQGWEPTTNSTHIWRRVWDSNPGRIGGRRLRQVEGIFGRHYCWREFCVLSRGEIVFEKLKFVKHENDWVKIEQQEIEPTIFDFWSVTLPGNKYFWDSNWEKLIPNSDEFLPPRISRLEFCTNKL